MDQDEACLSFSGDGTEPSVRFLRIDATYNLNIGTGGLDGTGSGKFPVLLQDGDSEDSDPTELTVGGAASDVAIGPARNHNADHVLIDIAAGVSNAEIIVGEYPIVRLASATAANVIDTSITARQGSGVTIGQDGDEDTIVFLGGDVTLGTASDTASTGLSLHGSAGTSGNEINEPWSLRGAATVVIAKDFILKDIGEADPLPLVAQKDASVIRTFGNTEGGEWQVLDDSIYDARVSNTAITGGVWSIEDRGSVLGIGVDGEEWTVKSDGQPGHPGLEVAGLLNPIKLSVSDGTVVCADLSLNNVVWDMRMENGSTVTVYDETWFDGDHPQTNDIGGFSTLTYSETGNVLHTQGPLIVMGELIKDTSYLSNDLTIRIGTANGTATATVATTLSRIDSSGNSVLQDFDAEEVTVETYGNGFEVIGPDDDPPGAVDYNPDDVLFVDSPCVRRWKKVFAKDNTGNAPVETIDGYLSTPISGGTDGGQSPLLPDALYAIDIEFEDGTKIVTTNESIYYTGDLLANTTGYGSIEDGLGQTYTPTQLTPTSFGDFDGDADGDTAADRTRFEDAWCTCGRDDQHPTFDDYDPLTDDEPPSSASTPGSSCSGGLMTGTSPAPHAFTPIWPRSCWSTSPWPTGWRCLRAMRARASHRRDYH